MEMDGFDDNALQGKDISSDGAKIVNPHLQELVDEFDKTYRFAEFLKEKSNKKAKESGLNLKKGTWIIVKYDDMDFIALFDKITFLGNIGVKYQRTIRGPIYQAFGGILDKNCISIEKVKEGEYQDYKNYYENYINGNNWFSKNKIDEFRN